MGIITRALANNITTGGVVASSGVSNTSVSAITSLSGVSELNDTFQLISSQTASASSSVSFTSGLDSTYDVYCFRFYNIHPAVDGDGFEFNGSTDGGSNYNATKITTVLQSEHREDDTGTDLSYQTGLDLDLGTGYQRIAQNAGSGDDENVCGELWLYRPDSTTQVKHFLIKSIQNTNHDRARKFFIAGYFNTTSAINAIDFRFASGNMDAGTIKLFGIRDVGVGGI